MTQALRARPDRVDSAGAPAKLERKLRFDSQQATLRLRALLVLFVVWLTLKNTWLSEDSFITYRVVDNFVHGLGLRWNPLERVQTYTHPLWMLLVSALYFVGRDIYFAPVALSLGCSAATAWLLFSRGLKSLPQCLLAVAIMSSSKAYFDFSTSGLENPLSHLLLVLFFVEYLKPGEERSFRRLVWFAGLGMTNRMDLMWFFVPALADLARTHGYWRVRHLRLWMGLLPFVAWEAFSVLYYGFAFPSSAYAKLTTGVSPRSFFIQGVSYLVNSISWDPVTLFAMAALVATALVLYRNERGVRMLSYGILLYVAYTIKVGGDYMSGRFLSAPFVASLLILSRIDFGDVLEFAVVMVVVLVLGLSSPRPPIQTNDQYVGLGTSAQGIDDERGYRHADTSLLRLGRSFPLKHAGGWVADALKARENHVPVSIYRNIGYYGFFAGPDVHIIDPYGIGDALMSHVHFSVDKQSWSPGHFLRSVPEGYSDAAIDQGSIVDPVVADYWDKLKLVTRGPIFDKKRLLEVVRFNLGMNPSPPPSESGNAP